MAVDYRTCPSCKQTLEAWRFTGDSEICNSCAIKNATASFNRKGPTKDAKRAKDAKREKKEAKRSIAPEPALVSSAVSSNDNTASKKPSTGDHKKSAPSKPTSTPTRSSTAYTKDVKNMPTSKATHSESDHLVSELKKKGWEETGGGWYNGKLTRELGVVTFDAALLLQLRGTPEPNKAGPRTCSEIDGVA